MADRIGTQNGSTSWTALGVVLYILGGVASLLLIALFEAMVLAPLGIDPAAGTLALSIRNGAHNLAWGLLVAAVAAPAGRRMVAGIHFTHLGRAVLAACLLVAAVATTLMNEFVRARNGMYDPEYAGLTLFTGPALVAVGLATWAALAVRPDHALVPSAAAICATAGLAISLLPSIPGAADAIAADSIPLAATFAAAVGLAALSSVLVIVRLVPRRDLSS